MTPAWIRSTAALGDPLRTYSATHVLISKFAKPGVKDRMATGGFVPWMATPADVAKTAEADKVRYAEIVKRMKISIE